MDKELDEITDHAAHEIASNIALTLKEGNCPWQSVGGAIDAHKESIREIFGELPWRTVSRKAKSLLHLVWPS